VKFSIAYSIDAKENMSEQHYLKNTFIPELGIPRMGKVRDIYENKNTLTLIASDRISVFDRILNEPIRDKGSILTNLSIFWFEKTKDIVPNHFIKQPDQNIIVVKKCRPIPVEMVVRQYMVGSIWRDYESGKRIKSGVRLPEGLKRNDRLTHPIVTPSTKSHEGHDEDISKEELIKNGTVTEALWQELESVSLKLFARGNEILNPKGIILLDTKYEFGLDESNRTILIDEIHTPDSSRFWFENDLQKKEIRFPDKEFAREWARKQNFKGEGSVPKIPDDIREKIREGYLEIYERITGQKLPVLHGDISLRVIQNLKDAQIIQGQFVLIIKDYDEDGKDLLSIQDILEKNRIPNKVLHLNNSMSPQERARDVDKYNQSLEPLICIAFLKNSESLGDLESVNFRWPIITTKTLNTNIPILIASSPKNAALAATRILKIKEIF
jgi:phosphoribosylaminoimidazole-succinocarboxamide synthase